jgi:hypothetical protein
MFLLIKPQTPERDSEKMQAARRNYYTKKFILLLLLAAAISYCSAQETTVPADTSKIQSVKKEIKDTAAKPVNHPRRAAIRSAILPGLGQIYNKKYWKLPIVYGAIGTSGAVFFYNLGTYKDLRQAYIGKYNARIFKDSTEYFKIKPELLILSEESIRFNRDQFRRNIDYSVLVFILLWGLNVVDAAVDAHLGSFDISPDLSLKIKPGHSRMAGTNGVSLVLHIGK